MYTVFGCPGTLLLIIIIIIDVDVILGNYYIAYKDKITTWYLNGFSDGSNLGSTPPPAFLNTGNQIISDFFWRETADARAVRKNLDSDIDRVYLTNMHGVGGGARCRESIHMRQGVYEDVSTG